MLPWVLLVLAVGCQVLDEASLRPRARQDGSTPPLVDGGTRTSDAALIGAGPVVPVGSDPGSRPPAAPASAGSAAMPSDAASATPSCTPPAIADYCMHIPPLAAEPVIDGELDCGARLVELPAVGWNGAQPMPALHRTLLAAAARANGLYVYVEVHGGGAPTPHPAGSYIDCGDAVEIYVDADGVTDDLGAYGKPGTMQFIVAAPAPTAPGTIEAIRFVGGESQGAWSSQQVRTRLLSDGYAVEAFIGAGDLELTAWMPAQRIGFDIAIDVAAPASSTALACGLQLGQYFLRMGPDDEDDAGICHGKPWCDTRAFCTPAL